MRGPTFRRRGQPIVADLVFTYAVVIAVGITAVLVITAIA